MDMKHVFLSSVRGRVFLQEPYTLCFSFFLEKFERKREKERERERERETWRQTEGVGTLKNVDF